MERSHFFVTASEYKSTSQGPDLSLGTKPQRALERMREDRCKEWQQGLLNLTLTLTLTLTLIGCKEWQQGLISNFEYLMSLNTLAGRTYNDLTQYPVFPWILSDYRSTEIDLEDPKVYRDLAKPMGAQHALRTAQFNQRYAEWEDSEVHPFHYGTHHSKPNPNPEVPPFHYGTHYSSSAVVLYYLIRHQP